MTVCSLKSLAYKKLEIPGILRSIKTIGQCPYHLAERLLVQMTPVQLSALEERSPEIRAKAQDVWKLHTLKAFPTITDTHDIEGDDIDWRVVYQDMQAHRRDCELLAREKLKAKYSQIASGKNDRKIQVTQLREPTKGHTRSAGPSKGPQSGIMKKIYKASENSLTRPSADAKTRGFERNGASSMSNNIAQARSRTTVVSSSSPAIKSSLPRILGVSTPNKKFFATKE